MENSVVSNIKIFKNVNLTTLQTAVNTFVTAVGMTDRVAKIVLDVRERRSMPEYVVTVEYGQEGLAGVKSSNVRGIKNAYFFDEHNITTLRAAIAGYIFNNPVTAPFSYGTPEIKSYMHRDSRHMVAMVPVVSKLGGSWRKTREVTDTAVINHYDVAATDEIIVATGTQVGVNFKITLPILLDSIGRKITVTCKAKNTGNIVVEGVTPAADDIVLADATTAQIVTLDAVNESVTLECNGEHWYVRPIQSVGMAGKGVRTVNFVDAPYTVSDFDDIICCECGPNPADSVGMTFPLAANSAGRSIEVIMTHYHAGGGTVIIASAATAMISPAGAAGAVGSCELTSDVNKRALFVCDGLKWYCTSVTGAPTFA